MKAKTTKKRGSYHSAETGKFVSAAYAKRYPKKVEFVVAKTHK